MAEPYYLYAVTWADARGEGLGRGVDPRYAVEGICYGRLAAVASRVGLDRFPLAKLEEGTADLPWLSQVAVRHNEIIAALAAAAAVLPMRLGTLFRSRESLLAKLAQCGTRAGDFLRRLEDRQEWAVKLYAEPTAPARITAPLATDLPTRPRERTDFSYTPVDAGKGIRDPGFSGPYAHRQATEPGGGASAGGGAQYLAAKARQRTRQRQSDAAILDAIHAVEDRLETLAEASQRLRPLGPAVTGRREKMVWNAAFLLSRSARDAFQAACGRLRSEWAPQGVILESSGPWPPYHFCPPLDLKDESHA